MNNFDKVILTDCDGVLMNWEYAFNVWIQRHIYGDQRQGFKMVKDGENHYDMGLRYGLSSDVKKALVKSFNESAAIGFLPPLRDAMYYVDLLHRKHGYVFHMLTSLSLDPAAQALRIQNTKKLFGETAFEKFAFADCGADKDDILAPYKDTGYYWIEDKIENAELGAELGLESIVMEHGHNMNDKRFPNMKNWKEIYEHVVGI